MTAQITRHEIPWGFKEIEYIISQLLSPPGKEELSALEEETAAHVGAEFAVSVPTCSQGIEWSIDLLTKPGAKIGIPRFSHPELPRLVRRIHRIPFIVDADPITRIITPERLEAVSGKVKLQAVVAAHLYGRPCDIHGLKQAAPLVPIIGDGAHALGAGTKGNMVGGMEHACSFSFRIGKPIVCDPGGIVTTNDKKLAMQLRERSGHVEMMSLHQALARIASVLAHLAVLRSPFFPLLVMPFFRLLDRAVPGLSEKYWTGRLGFPLQRETNPVNLHPLLAGLARLQLQTLDRRTASQVANARLIKARVTDFENINLPSIDDGCSFLSFPVHCNQSFEAVRILRSLGIDSRLDYITDLWAPDKDATIFFPPNHFRLSIPEVERVAKALEILDDNLSKKSIYH
ncbi:MAG: DegT/DnrJ/EryC1/StrS aminotransferase family protein [Deltaproteobacteria bacterium]|nr:DegT/DnrJ/EryC1/StrS aminotransferase family protein [Deltaproteobacteria bacterium]